MHTHKIRKDLEQLKIHLDAIDDWVQQAMNMVYEIEDKLIQDNDPELLDKVEWVTNLYYKVKI